MRRCPVHTAAITPAVDADRQREFDSAATLIPQGASVLGSEARAPNTSREAATGAGFRVQSEDDEMTKLPRNDLDRHDWATRASEALAQASQLPAGAMRFEAIRKAEQLGFAAEMRKWLIPKTPNGAPKVTG